MSGGNRSKPPRGRSNIDPRRLAKTIASAGDGWHPLTLNGQSKVVRHMDQCFFHVISHGYNCTAAQACKRARLLFDSPESKKINSLCQKR